MKSLTSHSNTPLNESENQLLAISEQIFELAEKAGCTAASLSLNMLSGAEYSVRNGEPETIERNQDKGLDVRVFQGDQIGNASTTDFSDAAIKSTVDAAIAIAQVTEGDPCLQLADASLYPTTFPDLELHHPHDMSAEEAAQFALDHATQCEAAALAADKRISNSEGASFSLHEGVTLSRNSNGFTGFSRGTRYGLSCSVIAGETAAMERDYWYDTHCRLDNLQSAKSIGLKAANRAVNRLNACKISTRRAPVLFDATVAPSILGHLMSAIAGNTVYKKATFLADKIDTQLFPEHINIGQHPHQTQTMGCAIYDSDGVATKMQNYVEQGRLKSYVMGQYSACRLGLQTTGNAGGVKNLGINHDDMSQSALMKKMGTGLLVTEMMGFGINIVTGDYSRGAAGFWIENGEIQYPVHEITLSGHLGSMFKGLSGVANDTNRRGNIKSGSLLIDEMTIGGS